MKRLFYPLLIVFFLNVSTSFKVADDDEAPTFWMYCDDKVFTYLELYSAYGAFHMHHQSSLGNFDTKGTFKLVDGALTLNLSNKKTEKYLLKDMTISPFPGHALAYTDFQPLIPTKRMNVKDAFKECGVQRLQKRKTGQK
jgi:hypothetical protein